MRKLTILLVAMIGVLSCTAQGFAVPLPMVSGSDAEVIVSEGKSDREIHQAANAKLAKKQIKANKKQMKKNQNKAKKLAKEQARRRRNAQ